MLNHSIILQNDDALILKTEQVMMSFVDTKRTFTYKAYLVRFGEWYDFTISPSHAECDADVISAVNNTLQPPCVAPLYGPIPDSTHDTIRDFYLRKIEDDNYILFTYRAHHIWFMYNDDSKTGMYVVTDLDGEEDGVNHDTIRDARYHIDRIFEA